MNKALLVGRLTHDPELTHTTNGTTVAKLRIAVNREGDDAGADYFTVVAFGAQAEAQAEYLSKSRLVSVDGKLEQQEWKTDNGEYRSKVVVIARRIEWLDFPPK